MSDTVRLISAMTDQAAFELLAMAILREAKSEYASLLHPGVNPAGKTVRSPVDGIGFVPGAKPPHMIAAHHTTCKRDDLRKKWLHNPAIVRPRKGGRPTMPAGDLIKTADIVAAEKKRDASICATLILTTNQEPPEELVRDAHAAGQTSGFEVDIWSVSRLAHVLDTTPSGQWLRREYLGIEQERISPELLAKLSRDSLNIHGPSDDRSAWVSRSLDRIMSEALQERDIAFIVAESGLGKSIACYKLLEQHVAAGGFGLVLPHGVIASTLTIEQAIDVAIRQLHPQLVAGAGQDVLSLCSDDRPLVLIIEDINRSGQPSILAEKLAKWSSLGGKTLIADSNSGGRHVRKQWRLLCPIWPQVVASLGDAARKDVERLAVIGSPLTVPEGREAVQRRAKLNNQFLSDLDADAISGALGHDPLLIALHEPERQPQPARVIERFIDASAARLANQRGEYTGSEYRGALRSMAGVMLARRELNPSWPALLNWLCANDGAPAMLRHLVHHGEVIRLIGTADDERLAFRHDRVRDALFSDAIAASIRGNTLSDDLISEPYFAEVIGAALLFDGIPIAIVERVRATNPLALFHALHAFREPSSKLHHACIAAIDEWLDDPQTHTSRYSHLRWEALVALSLTESGKIVGLVRKFKDDTWAAWQALFRNGAVEGGLQLCLRAEPGVGATWRDRQIEHAKIRFGSHLRATIDRLLRQTDLATAARIGALRLSGHLADPQLAEAIEASWSLDAQKGRHLSDYLWAFARCCGGDPHRFLGPVCDAWGVLPNEKNASLRMHLSADYLRFAFRRDIPISAIGFFIKRAKNEDLRWPITYMLHGLDHPDAVEFVVRELADMDKRLEGTASFSPFSMTAAHDWRRGQDEKGRLMSSGSRERLLALWQNPTTDKYVRRQAFRFWAATDGDEDLDILRSVTTSDSLYDSALWERLRRKDHSAISGLLEKLKGDGNERARWWSLGRFIWSDGLARALEGELSTRSLSVARAWDTHFVTDYQVSELIMALPAPDAEALLLKHWDHLRFCALFVQAALYVATPRLLASVCQVVKSCPNPKKLFKHLQMHFGIRTQGRVGVTRASQMEALVPYLDHLDDHTIYAFWELCNDNGWFDLRQKHLDSRLRGTTYGRYFDENQIIGSLDKMVNDKQFYWIDRWLDDYLKTGVNLDEVIALIEKWVDRQKTFEAIQVAAAAIIHVGRRQDLRILNIAVEQKDAADALFVDTSFAVKRRTLS